MAGVGQEVRPGAFGAAQVGLVPEQQDGASPAIGLWREGTDQDLEGALLGGAGGEAARGLDPAEKGLVHGGENLGIPQDRHQEGGGRHGAEEVAGGGVRALDAQAGEVIRLARRNHQQGVRRGVQQGGDPGLGLLCGFPGLSVGGLDGGANAGGAETAGRPGGAGGARQEHEAGLRDALAGAATEPKRDPDADRSHQHRRNPQGEGGAGGGVRSGVRLRQVRSPFGRAPIEARRV